MSEKTPKTDAEWLEESKDWPHITKMKEQILGQLAIDQPPELFEESDD